MAIDKSIDSAQLDADLASVADAIRTKGGTSAQLAFPADFVQAIEDIETGGGGGGESGVIDSDYVTFEYAFVTVGANSVSNGAQIIPYLFGLAGFSESDYYFGMFCAVGHGNTWVNNAAICSDITQNTLYPANNVKFFRYRNGTISSSGMGSSYDARLAAGDKYLVSCFRWKGAPTT